MAVKMAEKGRTVSAVNQAKIRAIVSALSEFLEEQPDENAVAEAVLKIGPVKTLQDVKKAMNLLIAYIPNATTREQLEGDGDGDDDAEAILSRSAYRSCYDSTTAQGT